MASQVVEIGRKDPKAAVAGILEVLNLLSDKARDEAVAALPSSTQHADEEAHLALLCTSVRRGGRTEDGPFSAQSYQPPRSERQRMKSIGSDTRSSTMDDQYQFVKVTAAAR
ncbi:hypothetical protein PsorP6_016354 [Peronosclerospora sorghi]|uniref:Uncharacterized protein n=1 Tax=Peronosclerospora sorghi TaxID=230839 RepID=A0ACC0VKN5_9STRA|nr:hypothetical protein PsorP6_016354 [Peronosclerospora sorghi]